MSVLHANRLKEDINKIARDAKAIGLEVGKGAAEAVHKIVNAAEGVAQAAEHELAAAPDVVKENIDTAGRPTGKDGRPKVDSRVQR
ncbi:MAG: hypothetical protein ACRD18_10055 [Terriglobia bacterium]